MILLATTTTTMVNIEGKNINLTNLSKIIWPEGLTKAHLVKYYTDIASYVLPHIKGRPLVMKRYPHGIEGEYFYQKECPDYAPEWIKTVKVAHSEKNINYIMCEDVSTLAWLANQGCIEIHAWLSQLPILEHPDLAIIDLDPGDEASFEDVMEVALVVKKTLDQFNLKGYPKTSGASGIHIFIPIKPLYTFQQVTKAMELIAILVCRTFSHKATIERSLIKREKNKVYVDYLQNTRGKSMAWTYSLRPLPGAPVSTPLLWGEIEHGHLKPEDYNIHTIFERLKVFGDIHESLARNRQVLSSVIEIA